MGFDWPATDHSDLQFGTGIGYVNYLRNTRNSGLEISPDSALTYALSLDDVILTLYDQFSYTRQVTTEAALANVATRPQLNNTAGLRVEARAGLLSRVVRALLPAQASGASSPPPQSAAVEVPVLLGARW